MSIELAGKLEKVIMDEHWEMLENRANPVVRGVWEKRDILPVTWRDSFETPSGTHPLEIPLVGGGNIRLGRTDTERPWLDIDIYAPNSRGDMTKSGTIIVGLPSNADREFNIHFDNVEDPTQMECIKFLARFKPEKDIDWEKIQPESKEHEIAMALGKYKAGKPMDLNR
jgi:hypothetical protein